MDIYSAVLLKVTGNDDGDDDNDISYRYEVGEDGDKNDDCWLGSPNN